MFKKLFILLAICTALGVGVYLAYNNFFRKESTKIPEDPIIIMTPPTTTTTEITPTVSEGQNEELKSYKNLKFGYELKYPSNFKLEELEDGTVYIKANNSEAKLVIMDTHYSKALDHFYKEKLTKTNDFLIIGEKGKKSYLNCFIVKDGSGIDCIKDIPDGTKHVKKSLYYTRIERNGDSGDGAIVKINNKNLIILGNFYGQYEKYGDYYDSNTDKIFDDIVKSLKATTNEVVYKIPCEKNLNMKICSFKNIIVKSPEGYTVTKEKNPEGVNTYYIKVEDTKIKIVYRGYNTRPTAGKSSLFLAEDKKVIPNKSTFEDFYRIRTKEGVIYNAMEENNWKYTKVDTSMYETTYNFYYYARDLGNYCTEQSIPKPCFLDNFLLEVGDKKAALSMSIAVPKTHSAEKVNKIISVADYVAENITIE